MTVAFLAGASVMAATTIALFFLRFWRESGDRFFAFFSLAFALFAVSRVVLSVTGDRGDDTLAYLVRAVAFGLILVAIVDRNRPARE